MSAQGAGTKIACTECGGAGYVVKHSWAGLSFPEQCKGCGGTGKQTIRKPSGYFL